MGNSVFRTWWLIGAFVLLCVSRQCSLASLIITIYHDDALYIAGDSAVTWKTGGLENKVQKVYPFSDNCCVAITGTAVLDLDNSSGDTEFSMNLSDALRRVCAQQMTNSLPLNQKMKSIATYVNETFVRYFNQGEKMTVHMDLPEETVLQFVGYDADKNCFFVSSCTLDRTNSVHISLEKEYRGATDPTPITFEGEPKFLQTLLSGEKPELLNLVSANFKDTAKQLTTTNPVDDASITKFILEMYSLQVTNSARLGYSQGGVGPPYLIFKISKHKVAELTSEPTTVTNSISLAVRLHAEDDKVIDAVMEKLAKTFKANDYSYAFEVMYTPIVEAMGGREKLLAAVPILKEQMKQQRISVSSWKSQKPYTYLRGNGRWFAVIPYVSNMTMAGQRLKVSGFELGIKNDGSDWQFVGGDKLTPVIVGRFFPDFPKDFELPKTQRQFE